MASHENVSAQVWDTLLHTVRQYKLIPEGTRVLVGVSGGVDSLALLHALKQQRAILGCELHVATLDHGLRGEAGAADARHVAALASAWGLSVTWGVQDVPALAQAWGLGLEAAARRARYAFFAQVAVHVGAQTVAVAHHADDQAETVLMHVLRGTGLRGLQGMRPNSPMPDHPHLTLIRPLLHLKRSQLEAYCAANALKPREDATNADFGYLRNRLRGETLPYLATLNPQIHEALVRLGELAALDEAYLRQAYAREVEPHLRRSMGRWRVPLSRFAGLHLAMQGRLLLEALTHLADVPPSHATIDAARQWATQNAPDAQRDVPGSVRLRLSAQHLIVERHDAPPDLPAELIQMTPGEIALNVPTHQTLPGTAHMLILAEQPFTGAQVRLSVPPGAHLSLRTRQPGDRFQPLGMGGHSRKLKDWLMDRKIPPAARDRLPLLCVNERIAAVILGSAWPIAEPFAVTPDAARVIHGGVMA